MARTEMYPSVTREGAELAKRRLEETYPGSKVWIEEGEIPQWGSAIPTSSTFGKTEPGFRVYLERAPKSQK